MRDRSRDVAGGQVGRSLPKNPRDGQEFVLLVHPDGTNGGPFAWRCVYVRPWWMVVGAPPLVTSETTERNFSTTSPNETNRWTPGISPPVTGDYFVQPFARQRNNSANFFTYGNVSNVASGAEAATLHHYSGQVSGGEGVQPHNTNIALSTLTAGLLYRFYGWASGGLAYTSNVTILATPVRLRP